jgi:predicted house-cleaning noncanonical NTP pyrophosphatase (MazG superfamily)
MANLFAKAKKVAPATTKSAKDKKIRLNVTDPNFFAKVEKLEQLNDTLKSAKAQADMISDEIKDLAKSEWVDYYSQTGKNPESVMIVQEVSGDVAQVMFIPTDKYITVTEARAEELRETYGEEIVEEETTFSFDSTMIEKYGEVLSMLIENCADITDADKEKIIKATTKYSVAKGTIDKLNQYGDVQEVMEAVKPVVALKNVEVIKG